MTIALGISFLIIQLMGLILFIIVLVKLFKTEGALKGILGFFCGIYTFIWGWMKHKELKLTKVMALWSVMTAASIVLPSIIATSGAYELLSYVNTRKGGADIKIALRDSAAKPQELKLAKNPSKIVAATKPADRQTGANSNANWTQKAVALWQGGEYTDPQMAIEYWSQAIQSQPNFAVAFNNRGLAYYDLKQYQQAIKDYTQAIALNPDYLAAYNNRGNSYYELTEYQLALKDFNQSLTLDSNYPHAHFNRALAYLQLDRTEQACTDFHQACDFGECEGLRWARQNGICN